MKYQVQILGRNPLVRGFDSGTGDKNLARWIAVRSFTVVRPRVIGAHAILITTIAFSLGIFKTLGRGFSLNFTRAYVRFIRYIRWYWEYRKGYSTIWAW